MTAIAWPPLLRRLPRNGRADDWWARCSCSRRSRSRRRWRLDSPLVGVVAIFVPRRTVRETVSLSRPTRTTACGHRYRMGDPRRPLGAAGAVRRRSSPSRVSVATGTSRATTGSRPSHRRGRLPGIALFDMATYWVHRWSHGGASSGGSTRSITPPRCSTGSVGFAAIRSTEPCSAPRSLC